MAVVLDLGQPGAHRRVLVVEGQRSLVGVDSVGELVVAGLVEGAEVVPHFGEVRVGADGSGVGVEGVVVLVDLVVEHADGAPESWVAAVAVDGLLVGLVGFAVLGTGHVGSAEEVPGEGVVCICCQTASCQNQNPKKNAEDQQEDCI